MNEIEAVGYVLKGIISELPEEDKDKYQAYYEYIKQDIESSEEGVKEMRSLAVFMYALEIAKEQGIGG